MENIIHVLFLFCFIRFSDAEEFSKIPIRRISKHKSYLRCTRRYSPGICMEPVMSVWSFAFQIQNCTERLGCPVDWRGNRFGTYESCMHRCLPLMELYMEILTHDQSNVSILRLGGVPMGKWDENQDGHRFLHGDEEYEVLRRKVTVEGPAPDPLDDDSDRKFQNTPDIDYYDVERKNEMDDDLIGY